MLRPRAVPLWGTLRRTSQDRRADQHDQECRHPFESFVGRIELDGGEAELHDAEVDGRQAHESGGDPDPDAKGAFPPALDRSPQTVSQQERQGRSAGQDAGPELAAGEREEQKGKDQPAERIAQQGLGPPAWCQPLDRGWKEQCLTPKARFTVSLTFAVGCGEPLPR